MADPGGANGAQSGGQVKTYTLDEAFEHIGFGYTQKLLFIFVGIAWAGDGMEVMLLSYLGPELKCKWNLSASEESWISSAVFVGMMFGSYIWGALADMYGRKIGFFAPAIFTSIFGALSSVAPSYRLLILFRSLVGFGIAGAHVAYTLFMEFLTPSTRGQFMTLIEGFWTLGAIFLAGAAWVVLPTSLGWRTLVLIAAVPLALLIPLYSLVRESPHWLLAMGRRRQAMEVLQWAAERNKRPPLEGVLLTHREATARVAPPAGAAGQAASTQASLDELHGTGSEEPQQATPVSFSAAFEHVSSALKDMVRGPALKWTTGGLVIVWFGVAMSYYGLILLGVEIHAEEKGSCNESGGATIDTDDFRDVFITSLGEVCGLMAVMALIDYVGRKRCLWIFLTAVLPSLVPLLAMNGGYFEAESALVTTGLFFTRAFSYASFVMLFIYTPELYPTRIRSFAFGLFNALCRLGGLTAPFVAVDFLHASTVSSATLIFFMVVLICSLVPLTLPIETKGRGLMEDVDEIELTEQATAVSGAEEDGVQLVGMQSGTAGEQADTSSDAAPAPYRAPSEAVSGARPNPFYEEL